jgi:hypothetical protein
MTTILLGCPDFTARPRITPMTFVRRRRSRRQGRIPLPPFSTDALPGTREKVAVLAERARLRVALWHPDDAIFDRDPVSAQAAV